MTDKIEKLHQIGFEKAGQWKLEGDTLKYELYEHQKARNILYAFVAENDVKYIGQSTNTLQGRMNGYQNPGPTQRTNIRVNKNMLDILNKGILVEIFVFVSKQPLLYRGFPINVAAGLEAGLIAEIKPEWNDIGTR